MRVCHIQAQNRLQFSIPRAQAESKSSEMQRNLLFGWCEPHISVNSKQLRAPFLPRLQGTSQLLLCRNIIQFYAASRELVIKHLL